MGSEDNCPGSGIEALMDDTDLKARSPARVLPDGEMQTLCTWRAGAKGQKELYTPEHEPYMRQCYFLTHFLYTIFIRCNYGKI